MCLHWEWQIHRLFSRHLWFSYVSQSCVYIGNCKFTDCPVVIYDLVTWVSHVSTLGMLFTDCPVVIYNSVTLSVLCLHIRRLLTDCSPSLMVHGHESAGQCRNDEHNESVTRRRHLKNAHSLSRITRLQLKTTTPPVMTDVSINDWKSSYD